MEQVFRFMRRESVRMYAGSEHSELIIVCLKSIILPLYFQVSLLPSYHCCQIYVLMTEWNYKPSPG